MSYTTGRVKPFSYGLDTYSPLCGAATFFNTYPGTDNLWPTANLAIYTPFVIPSVVVVRKLWVASGSVGTDNFDIGLFDAAGTKLVSSGATAKSASAGEHVIDVTDTTVGPGLYYIGLSCDSTSSSFYFLAAWAAPMPRAAGFLTEASAYPLPSTATFASPATHYMPVVGMLFEGSVVS